ncbi:MAG: SDR family NAD(P)-dependent oxidoreductase [Acidobacteriota bacterium]
MKSLADKTIILTGAAGGFGQEFVKQLLALGSRLIITDTDLQSLTEITDQIAESQYPGSVLGLIEANLSTDAGCEHLYQESKKIAPHIDMLINNAGVITFGYYHECPQSRWESLMQINILAPMRLTYRFLPDMLARGQGHIVFISSCAGLVGTAHSVPYSASKFALRGFGMSLSGEVKTEGIDITIIYPSWVKTPLLDIEVNGSANVKTLTSLIAGSPGRIVANSIKGIRRRQLHVYPRIDAKIIHLGSKVTPIVGSMRRN